MLLQPRLVALAPAVLLLVVSTAQPTGQARAEEPDADPELQADDDADDDEPPSEERPVDEVKSG